MFELLDRQHIQFRADPPKTPVLAREYLPADLIQAPLFLHFLFFNEDIPNGKVKAAADEQAEVLRPYCQPGRLGRTRVVEDIPRIGKQHAVQTVFLNPVLQNFHALPHLHDHLPRVSGKLESALPGCPAVGIRITGMVYGTGPSCPGISRSSIAALSDFPWMSMASVRVTPPPSALRMTKLRAPILGSS